jgi:hypothetical protein
MMTCKQFGIISKVMAPTDPAMGAMMKGMGFVFGAVCIPIMHMFGAGFNVYVLSNIMTAMMQSYMLRDTSIRRKFGLNPVPNAGPGMFDSGIFAKITGTEIKQAAEEEMKGGMSSGMSSGMGGNNNLKGGNDSKKNNSDKFKSAKNNAKSNDNDCFESDADFIDPTKPKMKVDMDGFITSQMNPTGNKAKSPEVQYLDNLFKTDSKRKLSKEEQNVEELKKTIGKYGIAVQISAMVMMFYGIKTAYAPEPWETDLNAEERLEAKKRKKWEEERNT